jgi:AcrR family transcriptional regulator
MRNTVVLTSEHPRNTRDQILQAAAMLFARQGYEACSMRDLAREVGLQPSSLYSHFASKQELLREIAFQCATAFQQAVWALADENLTPEKRLRRMLVAHTEVVIQLKGQARIFMEEWRNLEPADQIQYAQARDRYEQLFRRVIAEGIAKGHFAPIDEKLASLTLLSALNSISAWYRTDGGLTAEQLGQRMADLLLNGLVRAAQPLPN